MLVYDEFIVRTVDPVNGVKAFEIAVSFAKLSDVGPEFVAFEDSKVGKAGVVECVCPPSVKFSLNLSDGRCKKVEYFGRFDVELL